MRYPGPLRREPPPTEKSDFIPIMLSIAAAEIGLALTAFCLRDAGVIGSQTLLIILVVLIAVAGGAFIVLDADRQARRDRAARQGEVPPPFDIYRVWPPPEGLAQARRPQASAANDRDPPKGDGDEP